MSENQNRRTTPGGRSASGRPASGRAGAGRTPEGRVYSGRSGDGHSASGRGAENYSSSGRGAENRSFGRPGGRAAGSGTSARGGSERQSSSDRILAVQNARNLGSGAGRSISSSRSGHGNRKRGRRKNQGPDIAKILLVIIGVVILLICLAVGVKSCSKGAGQSGKESSEETTTEPETELTAEITVNGISVNGLTKSEAKEKILETIGWDMKISYNGEIKDLPDLMESKVEAVLDEAYSKQEAAEYTVSSDGLEDHVKELADQLSSAWDVPAKNGAVSSYDKEKDKFIFTGAENGKLIDRDALASDILLAVSSGDYKKTIEAKAVVVEPEITEEQARAQFQRIGTFTTTTTANKDRNENIRLASEALNGIILQPGEEFSMNKATGARTTEKGYKPAGAYLNGVLIEEPGGGVCQVSSTLYNAVVFAGLETTERHPHSYEPSYVTPGEDAMISYGSADMKFVNNTKSAIGIKTSFSKQKLTISIYGVPTVIDGVTYTMKSEKIRDLEPPKPEYIEDPTLEPGVEQVVKQAEMGSQWVTNLVKMKDGKVISDEFLHNSTYLGKAATIKRNTSGSVLTTEGETTTAPSESESTQEVPTEPQTLPAEPTTPDGNFVPGQGQEYGPGYETSDSVGVRPSEQPGTNILPSSPADMTTAAAGPVSIPQTAPQVPTTEGPQTQADPADSPISPNPANPE